MAKWENSVNAPDEIKIFESLADANWDFRTLNGISRATGLPSDEVLRILTRYADLVRTSRVPDKKGRTLYTLRERPQTIGETFGALKSYVTKRSTGA